MKTAHTPFKKRDFSWSFEAKNSNKLFFFDGEVLARFFPKEKSNDNKYEKESKRLKLGMLNSLLREDGYFLTWIWETLERGW